MSSIYVASLSDYNNGILYGVTIDNLEFQDEDSIRDTIQGMLDKSPSATKYGEVAEEWAIHDYDLGGCSISENEGIGTVLLIAGLVDEHGEAFVAWYETYANSEHEDNWANAFQGMYQGEHDSERDYAEYLIDEAGYLSEAPEMLQRYFDYEAFAQDLFMDGHTFINGHVFCDTY